MTAFGVMPDNLTIEQILEKEGERYLPLVHHILKRANPEFALQGDTDERIRALRLGILARNVFLFKELKELLNACSEAGIDIILLKGAMMEGIYPAGLRPFTDIDFLIRREKLPQVVEILSGLGYVRSFPPLRRGAEDFEGEVTYVKRDKVLMVVEPHWTLGGPYPYSGRVDIEGLWDRAKKTRVVDLDALILSPEDSLLHSCLHLFQHRSGGWLASSCDIAELTHRRKGRLDWQTFLSRVFEFRLCLPVRYSLQRTVRLFHPPAPDPVLDELSAYKPNRLERWVFPSLTSPGDKDGGGRERLASLLTMPGAMLRLRYLCTMLFLPREFMFRYYAITNSRLLPFYYLLHWKKAFVMGLKALFSIAQTVARMSHRKLRV